MANATSYVMNGIKTGLFLGLVIALGWLFSLGASNQPFAIAEQESDFIVEASESGPEMVVCDKGYNGQCKIVRPDGTVSQVFRCVNGICVADAAVKPFASASTPSRTQGRIVQSSQVQTICENGVCRKVNAPSVRYIEDTSYPVIEERDIFFEAPSVVQSSSRTVSTAPVRNRAFRPLARLGGLFCRRR